MAAEHRYHDYFKSDKIFHIMRDHPHHSHYILGGMFGIKKNNLSQTNC